MLFEDVLCAGPSRVARRDRQGILRFRGVCLPLTPSDTEVPFGVSSSESLVGIWSEHSVRFDRPSGHIANLALNAVRVTVLAAAFAAR